MGFVIPERPFRKVSEKGTQTSRAGNFIRTAFRSVGGSGEGECYDDSREGGHPGSS